MRQTVYHGPRGSLAWHARQSSGGVLGDSLFREQRLQAAHFRLTAHQRKMTQRNTPGFRMHLPRRGHLQQSGGGQGTQLLIVACGVHPRRYLLRNGGFAPRLKRAQERKRVLGPLTFTRQRNDQQHYNSKQ